MITKISANMLWKLEFGLECILLSQKQKKSQDQNWVPLGMNNFILKNDEYKDTTLILKYTIICEIQNTNIWLLKRNLKGTQCLRSLWISQIRYKCILKTKLQMHIEPHYTDITHKYISIKICFPYMPGEAFSTFVIEKRKKMFLNRNYIMDWCWTF